MKKTLERLRRVFTHTRETSRSRPPSPARDRDPALVPLAHHTPDSNVNPVLSIANNNQNTTYNHRGIVFNYNPVINKVRLAEKEKNVVRTIQKAIGDRFVPSAMYDVPSKEPGCMPGTRLNVLSKFVKWVKEDLMGIYWLSGLAGTGKTAIAVTLFRMLQDEPRVRFGGAFFCSRTANIVEFMDARRIIPTIAVALAEVYPAFATALAAELETDPHAALKQISDQIVSLLQKPLRTLGETVRPIVFIIDALDECSNMNEVEQLLQALSALTCAAKVKFIVTSRPDMHINANLTPMNPNAISRLHTIDAAEVKEDIRLYINDKFSKQPQAKEWYTESDAISLATSADGLFIFASTIIAYVLDRPFASPDYRRSRLQKAMHAMKTTKVANAPLDAMYSFVLVQASNSDTVEPEELDATKKALACILTARMPLSIAALSEILEQEPDTLRTSLLLLTALVNVPDDVDEPGLRTVHASFGDYLFERAAAHVRIAAALGHEHFARGCLQVMQKRLYFNVSQSRSSHEPNSPSKPNGVTLSLEYACLQWVYHLADLEQPHMFDTEINDSFCPNFLFWLEVMSILGQVQRSTAMLFVAIAKVKSIELRRFLSDANAFVVSCREAIERSVPHIYLSALPYVPKRSLMYGRFVSFCTGLVSIDTFGIDRPIESTSIVLTSHARRVTAVTYAPDGHLISGSFDGTLRIWNTLTGDAIVASMDSDDGAVICVDVAPRGASLAVGTVAGVVCLWDLEAPTGMNAVSGTMTGAACVWDLQAFQRSPRRLLGHSDWVQSVAFSPCGRLIASGSHDYSARLWRVETGEQISVMTGHQSSVWVVTFSPDGELLASGSLDGTVRLWNGRTRRPAAVPVLPQGGQVWSLCFTPDSAKLAVGLSNSEIILWEMSTTRKIATLRAQTGRITSVQFSRDGMSLLCCSEENDFRLYKVHQDAIENSPAVFIGHSDCVKCATFSPDGLYIASASDDHTIRIWDVGDGGQAAQTAYADKDSLRSVHVSVNGALIVTSHKDSVRVWDSQTGEHKLSSSKELNLWYPSVALFPPSRFVVVQDGYYRVQLLDALTGKAIDGPPRSHTSDTPVIVISHNSSSLARSERLRLWDVAAGLPSSVILPRCRDDSPHGRLVAAFSPDGGLIAFCDAENSLYIWDTATGQPVCEPFPNLEKDGSWDPVAFSHNNTRIACCRHAAIGEIWDIETGNPIITLKGHSLYICSIAFAPDDLRIATGSGDLTVRLWDSTTGAQLVMLHGHGSRVESVVFTPDGRSIVSGSDDLTIRVWDVKAAVARSSNSSLDPATALESTGITDGWLLGPKQELLLWIPKEYRGYLKGPSCRMVIPGQVSIVNLETRHYGANWTACWRGPPST